MQQARTEQTLRGTLPTRGRLICGSKQSRRWTAIVDGLGIEQNSQKEAMSQAEALQMPGINIASGEGHVRQIKRSLAVVRRNA